MPKELTDINSFKDCNNSSCANCFRCVQDEFVSFSKRKRTDWAYKKQLSEKEIDFLILFSKNKKPLSRNLVLKEVWSYSSETDTHTLETHIHRLRKKILEKFNDNNFIKNNEKGYYI